MDLTFRRPADRSGDDVCVRFWLTCGQVGVGTVVCTGETVVQDDVPDTGVATDRLILHVQYGASKQNKNVRRYTACPALHYDLLDLMVHTTIRGASTNTDGTVTKAEDIPLNFGCSNTSLLLNVTMEAGLFKEFAKRTKTSIDFDHGDNSFLPVANNMFNNFAPATVLPLPFKSSASTGTKREQDSVLQELYFNGDFKVDCTPWKEEKKDSAMKFGLKKGAPPPKNGQFRLVAE